MKKILFITSMMIASLNIFSQSVAVNETGLPADPTSMLDISSHTKGTLITRLRTIERTAIVNPAEGLLVFDTDTKTFWYFHLVWREILSNGGGGFTLPYIGSYADPDKVFSITNPSAASGGSAIHGKRTAAGSGISPAFSMGVWGDNSTGAGVVGTSNSGIGTYGFSFQNHGVYGFSTGDTYAGVYGTSSANLGTGVMGEISQGGTAVYGKSTGQFGYAGLFTNTNALNEDAAFKAYHFGKGSVGTFTNSSLATFPAMKIDNNGLSNALLINSLNFTNTIAAIDLYNHGKGAGINITLPDLTNTADGLNATVLGTGHAIYGMSDKGVSGMFYTPNAANLNETFNATSYGKGSVGIFFKDNTSGSISDEQKPAVLIDNNSKGNALQIVSLHPPSVKSGIDVTYGGSAFGINVNSTKGSIHGLSTGLVPTIVAENYSGGMAVKGVVNGFDTAAIYGEAGGAFGSGVLGKTTHSQGVGVRGISSYDLYGAVQGENSGGGGGVVGISTGSFGYGVIGTSSGWGIPGKFISNDPTANTNTLWVLDYSVGESFRVQSNNSSNTSSAMQIVHHGTGNLASFDNNVGERISFSNAGNIKTEGTVTVKGNKGIVRNSTSTQMRIETVLATTNAPGGLNLGTNQSAVVPVTFSTAFSATPVVYVGHISGISGDVTWLTASVISVTTTGCTLSLRNLSNQNVNFNGTWHLVVMGAE